MQKLITARTRYRDFISRRILFPGRRKVKLLLLLFLMGMSATVQAQQSLDQNITLQAKDIPLEQVLRTITRTTGVKFSFPSIEVAKYRHISFPQATRTVRQTLDLALKGTTLLYKTQGQFIIIARKPTDKRVSDVMDTTRIEGDTLAEVIVNTGYQSLPKERATGSFDLLTNKDINRIPFQNILDRLDGMASSVYFNKRGDGYPMVRGLSTIYSNTHPLIVLDNFPYDGDVNNINPNDVESVTILKDAAAASIWGVRSGNGVIVITTKKAKEGKISVEATSNFSVLSKPDLFYIPQISTSGFIDFETNQFNNGYYDASLNDKTTYPALSPVVTLLNQVKLGLLSAEQANESISRLRTLDNRSDFEKYFYRKGTNQQYAINVKGGNDNDHYYISAGYDKSFASLVGNSNYRITLRANNELQILKNLSWYANYMYTIANSSYSNNGYNSYWANGGSRYLAPYEMLADNNGNPLAVARDVSEAGMLLSSQNGLLDWHYRPLQEIRSNSNGTNNTDNLISTGLKYQFFSGLDVEMQYQYENGQTTNNILYDTSTYYTRNLINRYSTVSDNGIVYNLPLGGVMDISDNSLQSQTGRIVLHYSKGWNIISINSLLGAEVKQLKNLGVTSRLYGYNDELASSSNALDYTKLYSQYYSYSTQQIPNRNGTSATLDRFRSYFGNGSITYKERYIFSASARMDASNYFGVKSNQRAVPLYSLGLSWDAGKEKFLQNLPFQLLKLRLTYGYNGNINKSVTAYTTAIYNSNSQLGTPYAILRNPPNEDLRWERTRMVNLGVDFRTFQNHFSGSIEYYFKKGKDLIGYALIDPTTGLASTGDGNAEYMGNVAGMKGQGLDLTLNGSIQLARNSTWQPTLLLSSVSDRVTEYNYPNSAGLTPPNGSDITPIQGKSLYSIYAYKWGGLDPENGAPIGYLNGEKSKDYSTIISQSTIDSLQYIGNALPRLFGSFRNTFTWKGFSISANIMFRFDYYFMKPSISYYDLFYLGKGHKDYDERWQKPGDELITDIPSIPSLPNYARDQLYNYSSALAEKADFIRLQDIRIAYDMPLGRSRKQHQAIEMYLYLNNVHILWKANHAGIDPDAVLYGSLPSPFSTTIGFKINL